MQDKKAEWESWRRFLQEADPELREKLRKELARIDQEKPPVAAMREDERK